MILEIKEKSIILNHEVRMLLEVTCDEATTFSNTLDNINNGTVDTYTFQTGVYRTHEEDGKYIYQLLPVEKKTTIIKDDEARNKADKNASDIEYIAMMSNVDLES